ncbi:low temperature requirement protein A [Micromonospora globispora]|uniref:low temperature requirement protein A n=1 Tax=Micromonospora globispora TaxID=1450148 RepID=UPI0034D97B16
MSHVCSLKGNGTAWTTSRYDPYHIWVQTVVIIALVCSMVMRVAVPRAFSETALAFAAAYVVAQVSRPAILLAALGRHQYRRLKLRMLIVFSATGVLWVTGALLPVDGTVVLWTLALALEYLATRSGWPVPGLGRSTVSRWESPASTWPRGTSSSSSSPSARRSWSPAWPTATTRSARRGPPPSPRRS